MSATDLTASFISNMTIQPEGVSSVVAFDSEDPNQYQLFKNSTYTLLLRTHGYFDPESHDAFEVLMLQAERVVVHKDVFIDSMNSPEIRDIIREFNAKN